MQCLLNGSTFVMKEEGCDAAVGVNIMEEERKETQDPELDPGYITYHISPPFFRSLSC